MATYVVAYYAVRDGGSHFGGSVQIEAQWWPTRQESRSAVDAHHEAEGVAVSGVWVAQTFEVTS